MEVLGVVQILISPLHLNKTPQDPQICKADHWRRQVLEAGRRLALISMMLWKAKIARRRSRRTGSDAMAAEKKDGTHNTPKMEILLIGVRRDRKETENVSRDTDRMSRWSMVDVRWDGPYTSSYVPRTAQLPKATETVHRILPA
jgi:hypothetical protein